MVVAAIDTGRLPEMLARMRRHGPERIMEFSLSFHTSVATSGELHTIGLRQVAFLVYGKPGARLSGKDDVAEARAPGGDTDGRAPGLVDRVAPVVRRIAFQGQLVCELTVGGKSRIVLAAIRGVCTLIGADEDQSRIYRGWEKLAGDVNESPPDRWAHSATNPSCSKKEYSQTFRRPSGRFAAAIANASAWGTTPNCRRPPRRGRAVNQRRRPGTCRYRSPHTRPEAPGGRFSSSRARHPGTESWPGTSGSRFRQRPRVLTKVWTWSVAPMTGVNPIMARPLAACPNVHSFNCSTQGSGRPAGRRYPRAIAISPFVSPGWLVPRADWCLNLVGRPHTPQANGTSIGSPSWFSRGGQLDATYPVLAMAPAVPTLWVHHGRRPRYGFVRPVQDDATIPGISTKLFLFVVDRRSLLARIDRERKQSPRGEWLSHPPPRPCRQLSYQYFPHPSQTPRGRTRAWRSDSI